MSGSRWPSWKCFSDFGRSLFHSFPETIFNRSIVSVSDWRLSPPTRLRTSTVVCNFPSSDEMSRISESSDSRWTVAAVDGTVSNCGIFARSCSNRWHGDESRRYSKRGTVFTSISGLPLKNLKKFKKVFSQFSVFFQFNWSYDVFSFHSKPWSHFISKKFLNIHPPICRITAHANTYARLALQQIY